LRRDRKRERDLARQRIIKLLRMADSIYKTEPDLAIRYGELARRISLRSRVKIPREWRSRYCKRCGTLLFPGLNATIRTREKRFPHIVIRCNVCGSIRRIPYLREKSSRRARL